MGEFLAGVFIAGFAVFLYVKFKASRDKKASGGAGGQPRPGVRQK